MKVKYLGIVTVIICTIFMFFLYNNYKHADDGINKNIYIELIQTNDISSLSNFIKEDIKYQYSLIVTNFILLILGICMVFHKEKDN